MNKNGYYRSYIKSYNLIIDITKIIKDFLYPGEYEFERIDSSLPLERQIELIKKDLESFKFEKELAPEFIANLQHYYYHGEQDGSIDNFADGLGMFFIPQLKDIKEKLENKYLPFLKLISIKGFMSNNIGEYNDKTAWNMILSDKDNTKEMEDTIKDLIWCLMDSSKDDVADKYLKDEYKLSEIEFNRYIKGENNTDSSIIRVTNDNNIINANFRLFDKYFGDIIGQDDAITEIRKTLLRNIMFFNAEDLNPDETTPNNGPLATFMFYGPTGTGKTETAKRIAKFVFGSANKMIVIDMNLYKDEKISASALKGHPEGYVDSAKGTDFTRFLGAHKNGIIVLDEFEKSAKEVRELFMTMLDEGYFKDALGNKYDLSGYIFVATTNVSSVFENKVNKIGFPTGDVKQEIKDEKGRVKEELRRIFTAPIMNRFNNVIGFNEIKREDAEIICKNIIDKLVNRFQSKKFNGIIPKIKITNLDEIVDVILEESNFKKDGVRSLNNVINDVIGSQILEEIVKENDRILISCEDGKVKTSTRSEVVAERRNRNRS